MTFVTADIATKAASLPKHGVLRNHSWLAAATDEEVKMLAEQSHWQPFHKGQMLFRQGEEVEWILIVCAGTLNRGRHTEDGQEKILSQARPGSMVSVLAAFTPSGQHMTDIYAETDGKALSVSAQGFRALCQANATVAYRMLLHASRLSEFLVNQIDWLSSSSAEQRIAKYILDFGRPEPTQRIQLPLSRTQIASKLGIRAETYSRILTKWRQRGYISNCNGILRALDVQALRRLACMDDQGAA